MGDPAEDDDRAARVWDLLNHAQLERLASFAMQAREPQGRRGVAQMSNDWRALLTADMLAGVGEFDAESDAEAWSDEATDWTMEANHV